MAGAFAALALLVWAAATIFGIVILIKPGAVKVRSRWFAAPALLFFLPIAGLSSLAFPETMANPGDTPADVRVGGVVAILLWVGLFWVTRKAADGHAASSGGPGILERMAGAFGSAEERERSQRDAANQTSDVRARVDAERAFNARRASHAAYLDTQRTLEPKPRARRVEKPKISYDRNRPPKSRGRSVSIEYVDADGEITQRVVRNWEIEGSYLNGYCTLRGATRQFRLDRVIEWQAWD